MAWASRALSHVAFEGDSRAARHAPHATTGLKAKSDALREQRKKERLEAYTLKNFGDYFDFVEVRPP